MRRHIDYHVAQARAAASGAMPGARCRCAESANALSRTLLRLHADRGVAIDVQVAPDHTVRCQRNDLDEMLGNLLDNACKWAHRRVIVASRVEGDAVLITVDDDGPDWPRTCARRCSSVACAPTKPHRVPVSASASSAISPNCYGGAIVLDASPLGGLRATLRLPAA